MLVEHLVRQVIHGRTVAEMGVLDNSEAKQGLEVAVDGGPMHLRVGTCDLDGQFLGVAMVARFGKGGEQGTPGRGHPLAPAPQGLEDRTDAIGTHRGAA